MKDTKIKDAALVNELTGLEKIPVSNGSGQPAAITVNLILDKVDNKINDELAKLEEIGNTIIVTFTTTSDNETVRLFGDAYENNPKIDMSKISRLYIDGEETTVNKCKYIITTAGEHTAKIILAKDFVDLNYLFNNCRTITKVDFSKFDTSKIISMYDIFYHTSIADVDLSNLDLSSLLYIQGIGTGSKVSFRNSNLSGIKSFTPVNIPNVGLVYPFDSAKVFDFSETNLSNIEGFITSPGSFNQSSNTKVLTELLDFSNANLEKTVNIYGGGTSTTSELVLKFNEAYLPNCALIVAMNCKEMDFSRCNLSNVKEVNGGGSSTLKTIKFNNTNLEGTTLFSFSNCTNLEYVDLRYADLKSLPAFSGTFSNCTKLNTLLLEGIDLSSLQNISNAFSNCPQLTKLDFANVNFRNILSLENAFISSSIEYIDLSNKHFPELTTVAYFCRNSSVKKISFANSYMPKCNIYNVANGGTSLEYVDFSYTDLSKYIGSLTIGYCTVKNINFKGCNLSSITSLNDTSSMKILSLDFSESDMPNLTLITYSINEEIDTFKLGQIGNLENITFFDNDKNGTFYYDSSKGDYTSVIEALPSTWKAVDANLNNYATKDEIPTDYLTVIPEATTDTLGGVKKITIDTLADDADIATVVAAYNNLVNKLIESGLAATLLES